jgi:hypothetical protein
VPDVGGLCAGAAGRVAAGPGILAAEEEKWAALLGESPSWRTNANREVRHKALQVAQQRVQTALNRLTPKEGSPMDEELASALERAGL